MLHGGISDPPLPATSGRATSRRKNPRVSLRVSLIAIKSLISGSAKHRYVRWRCVQVRARVRIVPRCDTFGHGRVKRDSSFLNVVSCLHGEAGALTRRENYHRDYPLLAVVFERSRSTGGRTFSKTEPLFYFLETARMPVRPHDSTFRYAVFPTKIRRAMP